MAGEDQPDLSGPVGGRGSRPRAMRRLRRRRRTPWILTVTGIVLVAGVGAWQLYATLWTTHSEHAGKALIQHFLNDHALGAPVHRSSTGTSSQHEASASLASCSSAPGATPVHGLLEIPAVNVVAPVEQGSGDAVLAAAVGHDPYSVWPGKAGNAVLLAHDVSYFSTIDALKRGDLIRYVTPCRTFVFRVTSHAIVSAGSKVYNSSAPTITLVTCWPTDALWFTPDRYLVTATEVSKGRTGAHNVYLTVSNPPSVPVPAALVSQGVTLTTYSLPMGTFTLAGEPTKSWGQTTSPLLIEGSAVEAFIAGVRALSEDQLGWWHAIAPGVAAPAPLVHAKNPSYLTATDVVEHADGARVLTVSLTDTVEVIGGNHPGRYTMHVRTSIHGHTLTITSWRMTRT